MNTPHGPRSGRWLWPRLTGDHHGRPSAAPAAPPSTPEWRVDPDTETWWHQPPASPAGLQEIQARTPDGYDFARLVWQTCATCRLGLIAKIRVTGPWQRHGYASRMVRFALRNCDGYTWTTTPQSDDARAFFPALTETTGTAFPPHPRLCPHMQARGPRRLAPWQPIPAQPR
ncbi:GNAT superfamily N-acetyltransferase [Streptomyces ambofaciens]